MKGYKVFNPDWTCRGFQYKVGEVYEMEGNPICCGKGFHFCTNLVDCFSYYAFSPNNKVAEVVALGKIDSEDSKFCTNKISISREMSWIEVLERVNTGKGNSGLSNSGDYNSGSCNSGSCNSGNCNSGDYNSGSRNSGVYNSGSRNSGDYNSGSRNSGDCNSGVYNSGSWNSGSWNSGDWNSGDWNATNHSSGCFNTLEQNIYMFNQPSLWTYTTWNNSSVRRILNTMPEEYYKWVRKEDLTDDERNDHPESKTTGGYLKKIKISDKDRQNWYNNLEEYQKEMIQSIPNFDAGIFKRITGIDVNL